MILMQKSKHCWRGLEELAKGRISWYLQPSHPNSKCLYRWRLMAYKSLEGYNLYGWIDYVKVVRIAAMIDEPHYMITTSVRHSQKLSVPPAKPWVAVKQSGTVVCSHCSCMAGLGARILLLCYSHYLEGNTKRKNSTSCTSLPCSWLPPTFQNVPYAELSDIDFTTPNAKRRKEDSLVESLHWIIVGEQ